MNVIELRHASVRRDGEYILKDVSLTVEEGEKIAIIGPNGAGKSTLINVIARNTYPLRTDDYSLALFGEERWRVEQLKKKIGIVNHTLSWYTNTTYTVFDIVLSGLYAAIGLDFHHVVSEDDKERCSAELRRVGIWHLRDNAMNTLSSGERSRALLARAAITDPPLMLLDEASNALDFPSRSDLRRTISAYATEGKTILLVTHELAEIIPEIDRIIVMKDGCIFADGRKEEILTETLLSEVYGQRIYVDSRDGLYSAWC
ncbi:MAG: ATP-binding cassette domain-containing protein [Spirochaetales bacterium]|nr:ATP-binding cassette domain-containing protein [Spirochaetales bacterium]